MLHLHPDADQIATASLGNLMKTSAAVLLFTAIATSATMAGADVKMVPTMATDAYDGAIGLTLDDANSTLVLFCSSQDNTIQYVNWYDAAVPVQMISGGVTFSVGEQPIAYIDAVSKADGDRLSVIVGGLQDMASLVASYQSGSVMAFDLPDGLPVSRAVIEPPESQEVQDAVTAFVDRCRRVH